MCKYIDICVNTHVSYVITHMSINICVNADNIRECIDMCVNNFYAFSVLYLFKHTNSLLSSLYLAIQSLCTNINIYTRTYMYKHTHTHIHTHVYIYIFMYTYMN